MKMFKAQFFRTMLLLGVMLAPLVAGTTERPEAIPMAELDVRPQLIKPVNPSYPFNLKLAGVSGSAEVEFVIDKNGTVIWAKGTKSTHREFEKASVEAVLQWKFTPGKKNGSAVLTRAVQTLQFTLGGNIGEMNSGPAITPMEAGIDEPPQLIKPVTPVYPAEMNSAGLTGKVTVEFVVDVNGRVINPIIVASNNPWFERPAIEAILKWKYKPGRKDGRTVNTRAQQTVQFELTGGGDNLWKATKGKDHKNLPLEVRWDEGPEPIASTYPVYPADALLTKTKGRAVVSFLVNPQGRIQAVKLKEASAPEFGGAVIASVDVWRFKPATREGKPCSAVMRMEFDFAPSGDSSVPVSTGMREIVSELRRKEPRIYQLNKLDAMPKPLSRRPPVYPSTLKETGQAGEAVIEFFIDERGDVQLPRIVSATALEFGYAAAQAVAAWRFEPPMKGGKPVIAKAQIPIRFTPPTAASEPEKPVSTP